MGHTTLSRKRRLGPGTGSALLLAAGSLLLSGCGMNFANVKNAPSPVTGEAFKGNVFGGQQPVSGSTIQLYAASTTGYAAGSFALLTTPVSTDANGNFSITGDYTCPANALVYITATGGNPGLNGSVSNGAIAMMSALGACSSLTANTFVTINEVTTVASVYALAPFMSGMTNVGTSATNVQGLTTAFAKVNKLASTATGKASDATLPAGATGPVASVNTLGNILASCVNTGSASSSQCASLFSNAASASGTLPTDTIGAALNIALNPGRNVSALLGLSSATAPFQPSLTAAADFTLSVRYKPAASTPSAAAIAANGDVWVTNAGNNTISVLNATTAAATVYSGGGLSGPAGIAFDQSGNAWVTDKTSSKLSVFTAAGAGTQTAVVALNAPTGIAIDGNGLLWIANSGASTVTSVQVNGTTVNSATSYTAASPSVAVAINPF